MVECHWRPELALSDPRQQLSPVQFAELARSARQTSKPHASDNDGRLQKLSKEIDQIDQDLAALLAKRTAIFHEVERSRNGISAKDWASICATRLMEALAKQLPKGIEPRSRMCSSECPQSEVRSSIAEEWNLQVGIEHCGDSVSVNKLA